MVLFVYSRVAVSGYLSALIVAVGFALGAQSPASALTIMIAAADFVTLAALFGIVLSLAAELATIQSPRLRRYKNITYVIAFILGFIVWIVVLQGQCRMSLSSRSFAWCQSRDSSISVSLGRSGFNQGWVVVLVRSI